MRIPLFQIIIGLILVPSMAAQRPDASPAQRDPSDRLNSFAYCHFNRVSIVSVDRIAGAGLRYRTIQTPDGPKNVSMVDGYRLLLGQPGRTYFANVHVEKSAASMYSSDKDAVIKSFGTIVTPAGGAMVSDHRNYNGFDLYSSNNPSMKGNGPTGMYVLFRDSANLIVTIYFLDQKPEDRQFKTLDEYNALRDEVLKEFTTCANGPAAITRPRPATLPMGTKVVLDSFDSVSAWGTNPSEGVEISIHPDSGRNGRAMRVDFDFHGHGGYGIVNRKLDLDMPANYELAFALRGAAPTNTLEIKLVDPTFQNVWWSKNPNFIFSREWSTIARKKSDICFAWGPIGGGEISRLAGIEFAISAGSGGKGSIWIDDLSLTAKELESPFDATAPIASVPIVGTWESETVSDGGVRNTLNFAADGSITATLSSTMSLTYRLAGDRLTTTLKDPHTGNSDAHTSRIRIQHDTLTQSEENGPGVDVIMTRLRPGTSGDESLLGVWTYLARSGATAFVDFASNGQALLRIPMSSCSGRWTTSGGSQLTVSVNGQTPAIWDYSIKNGALITKDPQGWEARYTRRTPLR